MAIISQIGRKSIKTKLLIGTIYLLLVGGSITMVYPFLLMIAGSTKSGMDTTESVVIPGFLRSETGLYRKHMEAFFNENLEWLKSTFDSDDQSFKKLELPPEPNAAFASEWKEFLQEKKLPQHYYMISSWSVILSRRVIPSNLRKFKAEMMRRFGNDIDKFNEAMEVDMPTWNSFAFYPSSFLVRRDKLDMSPLSLEINKVKENTPLEQRYYVSPEGFYKIYLKNQYTKDIAAYNRAHGTAYASWNDVGLDRKCPAGPGRTDKEKADWEAFTRNILNLLWLRADPEAAPEYREFLVAKYGSVEGLNRIYGTSYKSADEISMPEEPPRSGIQMPDWEAFLVGWKDPVGGKMHRLPLQHISVHSADFMFRDWLNRKFGEVSKLNSAIGTSFKSFEEVMPPQKDFIYMDFKKNIPSLRWEYATRNFYTVLDFFLFHGRAVFNTFFYCVLAIACALIVNPLAAYALSRYRPPSTYKILLFLMLTMAFPPMVTQIPVFLMMRGFNLLNTFAALILPGLANGYAIFLLKGFFDSLPKELYESADLDGANEFQVFWKITMSLSTPILAVIALNAFTGAYGNFMFALLICQDQDMWTLMPWLYQLQMGSCQGVVFASLIIAAIPTFIIFSLCQNIIMRGIVVPSEK